MYCQCKLRCSPGSWLPAEKAYFITLNYRVRVFERIQHFRMRIELFDRLFYLTNDITSLLNNNNTYFIRTQSTAQTSGSTYSGEQLRLT